MKISYIKDKAQGLKATIEEGEYIARVEALLEQGLFLDQKTVEQPENTNLGAMLGAICWLLTDIATDNEKEHAYGPYAHIDIMANWKRHIKSLWSARAGEVPSVGQAGSFEIDVKGYLCRVDYQPSYFGIEGDFMVDRFEYRHAKKGLPFPISKTGYTSDFVYREQFGDMSVKEYAEAFAAANATLDMAPLNQLNLF